MEEIITKFTIAVPESLAMMRELATALAREKYSGVITNAVLESYIAANFNEKELKDEMNSMSNQWLTVYYNGIPAGYARITSKGKKPEGLNEKRFVRLADFGVLAAYPDINIKQALFDKCLSVCRSYDGLWINEYAGSPLIGFFSANGFEQKPYTTDAFELPVPSVCMIRENSKLQGS